MSSNLISLPSSADVRFNVSPMFLEAQNDMKTMIMQGLKNLLKGSLSNSILGDQGGGFNYQGQNVYVKAIKCKTPNQLKQI